MIRYFLVLAVATLSACSSTTHISSSDPDARIFVNGEYVGTGDAHYSDKKVAFSKNQVTIRKEGCEADNHSFKRNEKPDAGAIVGGILVFVPFLWVTEYKKERAYEYDCQPLTETGDDQLSGTM
jgi:hypothetical protein